jgi:pyruvate kinase
MASALDPRVVSQVDIELRALRDALLAAEAASADAIAATHPAHRRSAANLVHYVELRQHDIRGLQRRLAGLGLSSLGHAEGHVLANIETTLVVLSRLLGAPAPSPRAAIDLLEGELMLADNTERLLGPEPDDRTARIMVTMPSAAATDGDLVAAMRNAGMDVARINCAHDDAGAWAEMVGHIRATQPGRTRIAFDLGGPKLRTGPLADGPRVMKLSPRRDASGTVLSPAFAWLTTAAVVSDDGDEVCTIPVDDDAWLTRRRIGDRIHVLDSRGTWRAWQVTAVGVDRCLVTSDRTTFVATGAILRSMQGASLDVTTVGSLPPADQFVRVHANDRIVVTADLTPRHPHEGDGPILIGCTLPEVFASVEVGQRVWFDDGKIGGTIVRVGADDMEVCITDVGRRGAKLRPGKGINLPDTDLAVAALTDQDLADLDVIAPLADMVNVSFVRTPDDVTQLQRELAQRGAMGVGMVLKIENVDAFEHLPALLLAAMATRDVGVMIARGDLAVEVGFERLAEVQEEILWVCEAAHVPVIWATEVLDMLAKTGRPSRAEVTDAAMAERAECVMLNKGPHITEAIEALASILSRMQHHQQKKRNLLRRLEAWDRTPAAPLG